MIILSHRGYWKAADEKNALVAFQRSFKLDFGTETDIRDHLGKLVISHDPPTQDALSTDVFFQQYKEISGDLPLALNIKADGLQSLLKAQLDFYEIENYFVFDMSAPDGIAYLEQGLKVFTRQSEYEREPLFYEKANGVWIDGFHSDWVDEKQIERHLNANKVVALVSSELHQRQHNPFWERLRKMSVVESDQLIICTDFPEEARDYFYA